MKNTYLSLAVALSALAALIGYTGCGSGGSDEESLTKAQFAKQVELICSKAGNEQYRNAMLYLGKHPGADEADLVRPVGLPPLEKKIEEIKALPVPAVYEADMKAFTEEFEQALQEFKESPSVTRDLANSPQNPFKKANAIGEKLKLGDCGRSP